MGNPNKYASNFLEDVIFKINFPRILGLNESNPPANLQKMINKEFPNVKMRSDFEFHLPENQSADKVGKIQTSPTWIFTNKDKNKNLVVNPEYLTLEHLKYDSFDKFYEDVNTYFKYFFEIYSVELITRVGLRYINIIKSNDKLDKPLDWEGFLNPNITSITNGLLEEGELILRTIHEMEIKKENYRLRFKFGIHNKDYPADIVAKEFGLDYDCFTTEEMIPSNIYPTIEKFHVEIKKWFEKSITNDLRKRLNDTS